MNDAFNIIRENTWFKAIVTDNQLPTTSAILLHCKRIACIIKLNSSATDCEMPRSDFKDSGWKVTNKDGKELLIPIWDTADGRSKVNDVRRSLLNKCGCAKSSCLTGRCSCRKAGLEKGIDVFCHHGVLEYPEVQLFFT